MLVSRSSLKYSGFDPRTIGGCVLWLDAADSRTVTVSGGNVTAWADKSGSGYSAIAPASRNPTYTSNARGSNNAITCTNAQNLFINNFVIGQAMSAFAVYAPINQSTAFFMEQSLDAGVNNGFWLNSCNNENFSIRFTTRSFVNVSNFTTSNTWQLIEGINPDPNFSNYLGYLVNGVRQGLSSTAAMTCNTNVTSNLYINGRANGSVLCQPNYIGEIIIYNVGLPAKERQAVEGYLAWKWGIQQSSQTFSPLSYTNCFLWLDAYDYSNMTFSNTGVITQWNDKSGNNRHATATTSAPNYNYARRGVQFNGTSQWMNLPNGALPFNDSSYGYYIVFEATTGTNRNGLIGGGQYGGTRTVTAIMAESTANSQFINHYWFGDDFNTTNAYTLCNRTFVKATYNNSGRGRVTYMSNTTTTNTALAVRAQPNSNNTIANTNNNTQLLTGYLYEIIVYDNPLTTLQQSTLEQYLCAKWNIPGTWQTMPPSHPSVALRPATRPFQPVDICGCSLWLDAADSATVNTTASIVTRWIDKSGNRNDATRFNASFGPTYTSNVLNGLPGVAFGGAYQNTLQASSNILNGTNYSMFAVGNYANFSSNQAMCGAARQNYNSLLFFNYTNNLGAIQVYVYPAGNNGAEMAGWPVESLTRARVLSVSVASSTTSGVVTIRSGIDGSGSIVTPTSQNVATCAYPFTIGGYLEGGVAAYSGLTGNVHEVIVYQQALNAGQIRQVEGYLANKWGLRANFSSNNPFKTVPPLIPAFDPRQYGCFQWYDSGDIASLTLSNSNVYGWRDKSGNGYHLSNADVGFAQSAVEPTTGRRTVHFPTSNIYLLSDTLSYTSNMYFFVAARLTEPNTNTFNNLFAWRTNATFPNLAIRYYQQRPLDSTTPGDANDATTAYVVNGNPELGGKAYSNYTGATYTAPHTLCFPYRYTGTSTFRISDNSFTRYFIGYVYEVIVLSNAPNPDVRQRIEGYLTQKWGRVSDLSAAHPYRKVTP